MQKKGERQRRRVEEETDGENICKTIKIKTLKTGNVEKLGAHSVVFRNKYKDIQNYM